MTQKIQIRDEQCFYLQIDMYATYNHVEFSICDGVETLRRYGLMRLVDRAFQRFPYTVMMRSSNEVQAEYRSGAIAYSMQFRSTKYLKITR